MNNMLLCTRIIQQNHTKISQLINAKTTTMVYIYFPLTFTVNLYANQ